MDMRVTALALDVASLTICWKGLEIGLHTSSFIGVAAGAGEFSVSDCCSGLLQFGDIVHCQSMLNLLKVGS